MKNLISSTFILLLLFLGTIKTDASTTSSNYNSNSLKNNSLNSNISESTNNKSSLKFKNILTQSKAKKKALRGLKVNLAYYDLSNYESQASSEINGLLKDTSSKGHSGVGFAGFIIGYENLVLNHLGYNFGFSYLKSSKKTETLPSEYSLIQLQTNLNFTPNKLTHLFIGPNISLFQTKKDLVSYSENPSLGMQLGIGFQFKRYNLIFGYMLVNRNYESKSPNSAPEVNEIETQRVDLKLNGLYSTFGYLF